MEPTEPTRPRRPVTLHRLRDMRKEGEKIAMMTCYDASFARVLDAAGVDALLVGDSLGMVLQGHDTTLPVVLQDIVYHVACVARAAPAAWLLADLPQGSYEAGGPQALASASALLRAGARMVKLEGGADWAVEATRYLASRGVPVCGHIGLTPQAVHALGGWRVQGREPEEAVRLLAEAQALQDAGAALLVLELVPSDLAARITDALHIPVIGIGAGPQCSGQVLVLHDALGLSPRPPRFVQDFLAGAHGIEDALRRYVRAVKSGEFPRQGQHTY